MGQIIQHEKAVLAVEQNKVLIGPLFNRYVAWGFADYSIRMGPYESERAAFVWEDVPSGEILCCACPDNKIVITAGTSSVGGIWWPLSQWSPDLTAVITVAIRFDHSGHSDHWL